MWVLSLVCFEALLIGLVFSQELPADACERLTEGDLGTRESSQTGLVPAAIVADGDGNADVSARLIPGSINIVCEAQHEIRDRYRYTSVLFSYACSSGAMECDNSTITAQLTLSCVGRAWSLSVLDTDAPPLTRAPLATASTSLASACSLCIPPAATSIVSSFGLVVSNVTHCVECENCTVGLGRCFGSDFTDQTCCNYFNESSCVENCPTGQVPGSNFVCGAECSTLNDANGEFSYSDATGIGSVATLTCNNGFQANNSPATCTQSGQSADWRTTAPNCTPLCDLLPVLVNGNISYTNPPGELEAGTEANYNCDLGFLIDPENGNTRTCLTGGTWSGTSPTCQAAPSSSCDTGCIIGLAVGISVFIILIVLLVVVLVTVIWVLSEKNGKKKNGKKNEVQAI